LRQSLAPILKAFKRELYAKGRRSNTNLRFCPLSDNRKFEFLKDVSSMANADGGVIVYGVRQDQSGAPAEMVALDLENIDELHNRIDLILNDNLDERIPGLRHRAVPRPDGRHYYVVQVPQSYLAPHVITMPSTKPRFYLRVNTVNVPMTARQIKDASLLVERAQNRAIAFVEKRVEWNARFQGPAYIFNMVPLYSKSYQLDLTDADVIKNLSSLGSGNPVHSVHGYLIKNEAQNRREHVLITRDGAVEKFRVPIAKTSQSSGDIPLIAVTPLEKKILEFSTAVATHAQPGVVELPALISLNLVGLKGIGIWGKDGFGSEQVFDEDQITPDPVILHSWSELEGVLKNFFDVIWQSFGEYGSPNYDENGVRRNE
jgi:hypothetical protein